MFFRIQFRSFWYKNEISTTFLSKISILPIFGHGRGPKVPENPKIIRQPIFFSLGTPKEHN